MFVDENYMRPVNKGPLWRIVSHKKTIKFWGIDLFMLRLRQSYTSAASNNTQMRYLENP